MKLKVFLFLMLAAVTASSYAQEGGIRGKVVSRNGRAALSDVGTANIMLFLPLNSDVVSYMASSEQKLAKY